MLSSHPKVSVIIPTLFREKYCLLCVEDLMVQDYDNFEIILVEEGVRHAELVALEKRLRGKVTYYFIGEKGSMPKNRNFGISHATGEIIVFLDDDCRVPENFISKGVEPFLADAKIGALSPRIIHPHELSKTHENVEVGKVTSSGKIFGNYQAVVSSNIQIAHRFSFFLKSALDEVAGFDAAFRGNALRSEADLSLRLARKGYAILFDPAVEFIHVEAPLVNEFGNPDRMSIYFDFFFNDFLFFLKNFSKKSMPAFFIRNLRAVLSCMFLHGRAKPKALSLPFRAYWSSYKVYKMENTTL